MATLETPSASDQTLLGPALQNHSEWQIAVANTSAVHFQTQPQQWIIPRLGIA